MDIARFKKLPVMGILRGVGIDAIKPLMETAASSGLETVEITMNSKNAARLIKRAHAASGGRMMIGAGTVLNLESLKTALDAGATFIVTPVLVDEVMEYCVKNVIAVFPGASTPGEIFSAWSAGATMVKVFPSVSMGGPAYFKELRGPFDKMELLACGGVTSDNIGLYFANGANAVAFGASIFDRQCYSKADLERVSREIKKIVSEVAAGKKKGRLR